MEGALRLFFPFQALLLEWALAGQPWSQEAREWEGERSEKQTIFCLAVVGELPSLAHSQSETISDQDECLLFPGAET